MLLSNANMTQLTLCCSAMLTWLSLSYAAQQSLQRSAMRSNTQQDKKASLDLSIAKVLLNKWPTSRNAIAKLIAFNKGRSGFDDNSVHWFGSHDCLFVSSYSDLIVFGLTNWLQYLLDDFLFLLPFFFFDLRKRPFSSDCSSSYRTANGLDQSTSL